MIMNKVFRTALMTIDKERVDRIVNVSTAEMIEEHIIDEELGTGYDIVEYTTLDNDTPVIYNKEDKILLECIESEYNEKGFFRTKLWSKLSHFLD